MNLVKMQLSRVIYRIWLNRPFSVDEAGFVPYTSSLNGVTSDKDSSVARYGVSV